MPIMQLAVSNPDRKPLKPLFILKIILYSHFISTFAVNDSCQKHTDPEIPQLANSNDCHCCDWRTTAIVVRHG